MRENLRTLHLTPEFPPYIWGGLGRAVGGIVSNLQAKGQQVAVAFAGHGAGPRNLAFYGNGTASSARSAPELQVDALFTIRDNHVTGETMARIKSWRPQVLHVHSAWQFEIAEFLKYELNVPLVYTVHAFHRAEYDIGRNVSWEWTKEAYREQGLLIALADGIIVLSEHELELLCRYYPWAADRAVIIGNGVDDCDQPRISSSAQNKVRALYAGRMDARKGISELMAAIPKICARTDDVDFVFAGGWRTMSARTVRESWLKGPVKSYAERISFLGWLNASQLCQQYRTADILIVPSRYEPFGLVLLEGMVHGLAVVASGSGGAREIIRHDGTGLLFPCRDVDALAEAVLLLAQDSALRETVARNGRSAARKDWLWSHVVGKMSELYAEVA